MPGVTLPVNAGAYGPFHIITRDFAGGQIIDIGANFGSIYVKPNQVTRDGTNGVLYVTAEEEVEIRQRTELEFRFRIDFDIWKRDVLVLASPWKVD